jgi:hypothetical protein
MSSGIRALLRLRERNRGEFRRDGEGNRRQKCAERYNTAKCSANDPRHFGLVEMLFLPSEVEDRQRAIDVSCVFSLTSLT